jgi:hypothetical protein
MKKVFIIAGLLLGTASCSVVKNDSLIKSGSVKSSDDVYITTIQESTSLEPGLDYTIYISDGEGIIENLKLLGRDKIGIKKCETPGVWLVSKTQEETEKVVYIEDLIPYRRPVRFQK